VNERIEKLAIESGLAYKRPDGRCWIDAGFVDADLERFAELVAAKEREACAKLVEEVGRQTAAAIRARSKHDTDK